MPEFTEVLTGVARVHKYFQDILPADKLEPFAPSSFEGDLVLSSHTRYFTPSRHLQFTMSQPFGPGVDPYGDLAKIGGQAYIHTEDNIVQYLAKKNDNGSAIRYVIIHEYDFIYIKHVFKKYQIHQCRSQSIPSRRYR